MARIGNVGGYRRSYRPTYNRRSTSRRTSYQRPKAKPGPRATIKRKPKPVIRKRTKPKTVSRPTKKVSPKPQYTPSKAGMPSSVQNRIAKNTTTKKTWKSSKAGMPSSVADRLEKQEAAKQASKQISASKPVQTVSTGVSYQKTNTSQTPKQDTYAKIYKKPISTPQAAKQKETVKPKLENINLPKESRLSTPSMKEKENANKKVSVDELIKKGKVDKFIFTENNATYLRTREGREIRIDNGHYKKAKKKDYTSLHIRNVLGKVEEKLGKSKQGMQASFFVQKEKLGAVRSSLNIERQGIEKQSYMVSDNIRFGSMPKQDEKSILLASQDSNLIGEVSSAMFTAGVAKIPYMDDSLKIDQEPIRINSPYDYKNYVEKKSYEDPGNKFYQKTLHFLEEKLSPEVKKEDIEDAYQTNPNSRTEKQKEIVTEFEAKVLEVVNGSRVNEKYVTMEQLEHMKFSEVNGDMVTNLNNTLEMYGITDTTHIQHFLTQCRQEGAVSLTEAGWLPEDVVKEYTMMYEPGVPTYRSDGSVFYKAVELGNTEEGDGYRFRGGGYIQITGRSNYQDFADSLNDEEAKKRIMSEGADAIKESYAWQAAGFWWSENNMNQRIDNGASLLEISRAVNRGPNATSGTPYHMEERTNYYTLAQEAIK